MQPDAVDSLNKDALSPLVGELLAQVGRLLAQNATLSEQVRQLLAQIAELEARAGQPPNTPSNSSVPPSRGDKANRPEKTGQRRKGRPGVARELCRDPDATREIYAERCSCGAALGPGDQPHVHAPTSKSGTTSTSPSSSR